MRIHPGLVPVFTLLRFEHPMGTAIIVYVVPPAHSHQEPATNILYQVEIGRQPENHQQETFDEGIVEEGPEQISSQGGSPEKDVEECHIRVARKRNSIRTKT